MENMKKIFYASVLTLCCVSFTSCGDDETYDFPGDAYNRVYIQDKSNSYKIVQTPVSTISNIDFELAVKCTQKASGDIKATIEIDNSMIAAYNEENGTSYEEFPSSALVIENATMTIPTGTMASTDTLHITATDDEDVLATLTSENGYLIPLRISTTEGGNAQSSSNYYSTYLTVTVTEDNVNHDATEDDITGTLVEDQTGWSASTNGRSSGSLSNMFNGSMSSYTRLYLYTSDDLTLDVDMGQEYTFDAVTLYYGFSYGSASYEYGQFSDGMEIYISDDGETWELAGEVESSSSSKICVFYSPITTRYIRILKPSSGSYTYIYAGIFNVYATN